MAAPLRASITWAQTRATNGFLEALNGLFQTAKRKARGYRRFAKIRTVIFLSRREAQLLEDQPHTAGQRT